MKPLPRATFVLVLALTAISCGGTDPENHRSRIPFGPSEIPGTTPQRIVSGTVQNKLFEPIAGAQVAIVGTSLSTVTDSAGRFELQGNIDSAVTVQAAKDGYIPQTQEPIWRACPSGTDPCLHAHVPFFLNTVAPAIDIAGEYSVTILADANCADLPAEARARSYTASIASVSPDNTSLAATISGASLYVWGSNTFNAEVAGDRFVLRLEGSWVDQAFMEEVGPNTYVGFSGTAAATVTPPASTISAALDGSITYCRTTVRLDEPSYECSSPGAPRIQPETFKACQSKNHRMIFTRR